MCLYLCECVCPQPAVPEVFRCLQNITHGHNGTNVIAGTDTNTIKRYCIEGLFDRSVRCLVSVFQACAESDEMETLLQMVDPLLWDTGVRHLCHNLDLHAEFSACIVEQRSLVYECLKYNDLRFNERMQIKQTRETVAINFCRYYEGMRVCTAKPIERRCGENIGRLLSQVIRSLAPHMCSYIIPPKPYNAATTMCGYLNSISVGVISFLWMQFHLYVVT